MIPVNLTLDRDTFLRLETIANRRGMSMRELIVEHLRTSLHPEPHSRVVTNRGTPVSRDDIDAWITAAGMGVTNRNIAARYGVSEQLVSRVLNAHGIYRQRRREVA